MDSVYHDFLNNRDLKQRIEDAKNIPRPNEDPTQHLMKLNVYEVEFLLNHIAHQEKVIKILQGE